MTTETKDILDLGEWTLVLVAGKTLFGRGIFDDDGGADRSGGRLAGLCPCVELTVVQVQVPQQVQGPNGQPMMQIGLQPQRIVSAVAGFGSIDDVMLSGMPYLAFPFDELSPEDQAQLRGGVEQFYANRRANERAKANEAALRNTTFGGGAR